MQNLQEHYLVGGQAGYGPGYSGTAGTEIRFSTLALNKISSKCTESIDIYTVARYLPVYNSVDDAKWGN